MIKNHDNYRLSDVTSSRCSTDALDDCTDLNTAELSVLNNGGICEHYELSDEAQDSNDRNKRNLPRPKLPWC